MGMSRCLECERYGDSKNDVDDCYWGSAGYVCSICCEDIKDQAEKTVIAVRGSCDVPGFELCVAEEMNDIIRQKHPSRESATNE